MPAPSRLSAGACPAAFERLGCRRPASRGAQSDAPSAGLPKAGGATRKKGQRSRGLEGPKGGWGYELLITERQLEVTIKNLFEGNWDFLNLENPDPSKGRTVLWTTQPAAKAALRGKKGAHRRRPAVYRLGAPSNAGRKKGP